MEEIFFIDMLTTNKHTLAIFIQMSLGNVASNRITISGSGARGEINTTAVCSPSHSTAPPFSVNAIYFRRQKNAKCSPPWKICFAILFKRSYDEERCWAKIYTEHHISENQGFGTNRLARAQTISSHSHHFDRHDWVLQRRGARIFMILYKNNLCSLVRDGSGCQAFLC